MFVLQRSFARVLSIAALAASAGAAHAQLLNTSFETAGTSGRVFANWIDFGNSIPNISRAAEFVNSGAFSCKMFGQFTGDFNVTGIFQDLPTTRDQVWDAAASFGHLSNDAVVGLNSAVMNIEFRASNGDLLEFWTVEGVTPATPTNTLFQRQISAVAPDDAVVARIIFLFLQPDLDAGAVHIDDASLASSSSSQALINPGFELAGGVGAAQGMRGWGQFPRFATNIFQNSDVPRTGTFAGFLFGQFTGAPNFNGLYQTFDVMPGQRVDAEAFARHKATDALATGNYGFINLEFQNAAGQLVGPIITNPGINSLSPLDTYIQLPVSGVVPAGAVKVRLVIGMYQDALGGGGVHFDDASITVSTPPAFCLGDANGDQMVSFADISAVLTNFGNSYVPGSAGAGDADNNGIVAFSDISIVLQRFGMPCS